jgi:MiaB/RimO family radical SAM methylthiotransferase
VYGLEFDSNLAKLLKEIVSIDRDFKIRVGMGNPKYILPYLDELINIMKSPKVFKFIHIPLQAGSDKILSAMKREYKASDFIHIVNRFKEAIPGISIMTDIICGFPGETEGDFNETLTVLRETQCDMVNVSRFWPRPGTPAARMKQVDGAVAKERCKQVMELFHKIGEEHNKAFVGKQERIIITEQGKDSSFIGKNSNYKQVVVKGKFAIGKEIDVKITSASSLDLRGEVV